MSIDPRILIICSNPKHNQRQG
nr:ribosomal protein L33 [Plicosepalus curviflorus]UZC33608.1 ribosomal protein L33 [Plicosepalus curviflorus]